MKRIFLLRHCKANGQEPGAGLTTEGLEQAFGLADFLCGNPIDLIISSTYKRAIATVEPLAQKLNLEINTDARLCERILSSEPLSNWEDKLYETFQNSEMRLPGGETSLEAMERGISVLVELFEQSARTMAVVTHGNLLCLMLRYFNNKYGFDDWKKLTNPDVYELVISNNKQEVSIQRIWKQH